MLKKIKSNLRLTLLVNTIRRIIEAFRASSLSADAKLSPLFADLEQKYDALMVIIGQSSPESVLAEKDGARDGLIRALFYIVQGASYVPDPDVHEAANKIKDVLDDYGLSIQREVYSEESTQVELMLASLNAEILQESIAKIVGCTSVIQKLRAAQDDFETSRLQFDADKVGNTDQVSGTELRREILSIFNGKIVPYLRGMEIIEPDMYHDLVGICNEIVEDNNTK